MGYGRKKSIYHLKRERDEYMLGAKPEVVQIIGTNGSIDEEVTKLHTEFLYLKAEMELKKTDLEKLIDERINATKVNVNRVEHGHDDQ